MSGAVKSTGSPRTLRAEQAEQTRHRIVDAARKLFLEGGYPSTTITSVAEEAGVAVETVYSRFGSKANLLRAILERGIVDSEDGRDVFDRPAIDKSRSAPDQRSQLQLLDTCSRGILERTYTAHRIRHTAA